MYRAVPALALAALVAAAGGSVHSTQAQQTLSRELEWAAEMAGLNSTYRITPNVTYLTASNTTLKLDV